MPLVILIFLLISVVSLSAPKDSLTFFKETSLEEKVKERVDERDRGGVYDAGDPFYRRFQVREFKTSEEITEASQKSIYIRFPPVEANSERLDKLLASPPHYVIRPRDTRENGEVRFLHHLYKTGQYDTFLSVYQYFVDYRDSEYRELVDHLAMTVHYKIFQKNKDTRELNKVKDIYNRIENQYPESKFGERNHLILAYTNLKLKNVIEALQGFIKVLDRKDWSEEYDFALLSLAETYLLLNRPQTALDIYKRLVRGNHPRVRGEAHYGLGDIYFHMGHSKAAVESYHFALTKYSDLLGHFPNAYYNLAESLFWLGRYKESLENYVNFIRIFPDHKHGGYALTRIGELLAILGVDQNRARDTFFECQFRFRGHPGAKVVRVRELSGRMKNMKIKELKRALVEMEGIARNSQFSEMSDFVGFMVAEGFHRRGDYEKAINYLTQSFRENYRSPYEEVFKKKIVENIAFKIRDHLVVGDVDGAFKEYEKQSVTWLKYSDRVDVEYLVGQMFERMGLFGKAIRKYENVLSKLKYGREEEKGSHFLPTRGSVRLRLAASYMGMGKGEASLSHLLVPSTYSDEERAERAMLLGRVYEDKGQYLRSQEYLDEVVGSVDEEQSLPLKVSLARLQMKMGELGKAGENLDELDKKLAKGLKMDSLVKKDFLRTKAKWLYRTNKKMSAVDVYVHLLEDFESSHRPMNSMRYKAGKILFEEGHREMAEKIWMEFKGGDRKWYRRLVQENLRHEEWMGEHKIYIKKLTQL